MAKEEEPERCSIVSLQQINLWPFIAAAIEN